MFIFGRSFVRDGASVVGSVEPVQPLDHILLHAWVIKAVLKVRFDDARAVSDNGYLPLRPLGMR